MSIQIALTLECICTLINLKVFNRPCSSLPLTLKNLDSRFVEHVAAMEEEGEFDSFHKHNLILWKAPPQGCVKLNTDAVVKASYSSIAVIARDAYGFIFKTWALCVDTVASVIAEAQAIKWALELANLESFPKIIVESDSKMCIDVLVDCQFAGCWKIDTLCADVNNLISWFLSCCFSWVKREANSTVHELASSLRSSLSCNAYSLPPFVFEA